MAEKIRMGMVGGGIGAFIGNVHRMAAGLDGKIDLVAGAFSSDPKRSIESGEALGLDPSRVYGSFQEMIDKEKSLPADTRIHLVSIVTPNHMHFEPAVMALQAGFHVICDKPMTFDLEQAYILREEVKKSGNIFALTHNYTGYPMVKQARHVVQNGSIGKVRKVVVEYPQGWLSTLLEASEQKQAAWRTDPTKSGIAGAMGDIGTHAENLAEYITGLKITELCADISTIVPGRQLDDDGSVLLRFDNGARGILHASQICAGEENNLSIRVYCERGGIEWKQMEPNSLVIRYIDEATKIFRTGGFGACTAAQVATRIPAGHPEGYLEAFANIYNNVATCIAARLEGKEVDLIYHDYPTVEDGVRGMQFIYKVIESGKSDQKWLSWT